jgi:hypothetical protein
LFIRTKEVRQLQGRKSLEHNENVKSFAALQQRTRGLPQGRIEEFYSAACTLILANGLKNAPCRKPSQE